MKRILVAAAVLVAMTSPAFAKHCPKDAAIIDKSLPMAKGLDKMQMTKVKEMRDRGMALHKSGKHGESIKVLHEAIKILGVEPYKPM
ncbi:MAG: hypothetical protein QF654_01570 [Alphaproteobacteria bacterium]|jgi:hypothetical protein|nr:hypothetical protein [Alphaproteobacteria bacterium]|tara:strand:- start:371 stop:631 length:261 start_codon:yes stop_codon:yes gene_type:complete